MNHLFVSCSFAWVVRDYLCKRNNLIFHWFVPSLDENLTDLCKEASIIIFPCFTFGIFGHAATFVSLKIYGEYYYLPMFYIWNIWSCHILCIFEDIRPEIGSLCYRIMDQVISYHVVLKKRRSRLLGLLSTLSILMGNS